MTTNNPDPLEEDIARTLSCHLWATIVADNNDDCDEFDAMPDYIKDIYRRAAAAIIAQHYAPVIAENADLEALVGELGEALRELEQTEADYRHMHDLHGGGSIKTGRRWDWMRRAGDKARATLAKLEKARG